MASSRVYNSKLYIQIAQAIRTMIEDGKFVPGDRLPPLSQLAEQFNCSRATVREALGALRGQGLIEFRHGDGTYVRTASIDMWMEPLDAALLLAAGHVQQIVQLQIAVLAGIATLAAKSRSTRNLDMLNQALFRLECANPAAEEAVVAEVSFYLELAEFSDNSLLVNVMRVMQEAFRSSLRVIHGDQAVGLYTCRKVYEAVRDGDEKRARELIFAYGDVIAEYLRRRRESPLETDTIT